MFKHRRLRPPTIAAALLAGVVTAAFIAMPGGNDLDAMIASSVMIKLDRGHGSGVAIAPHLVLTNHHVVDGEKTVKVRTSDGAEYDAEVLWASPTRDVALLRVNDANLRPAELACRAPKLGEALTGIGNPIRSRFHVATGRVASVLPIDTPKNDPTDYAVPVDMAIAGGMSGGPVFDADGRVLGLMEAVMIQPLGAFSASLTGVGMMVPAQRICDLLGRAE